MVDKVNINLSRKCQHDRINYPLRETWPYSIYNCDKSIGHEDEHKGPWSSKGWPNFGPNPLVHDLSNVKLYLVGGAVREIIRGHKDKVKDWDFAVEADSYELMKVWILANGFEIFVESDDYFTIRARAPKSGWKFGGLDMSHLTVDFTLCRKDGTYYDGRHPDTVEMGTLFEDLSRRDFTMNAIAMSEDGMYIDPFNGREAIADGHIICVGGNTDRLREDGLRVLRALRFSIQLGFRLSWNIQCFMHDEARDALKPISVDRIRDELGKAFRIDSLATVRLLTLYTGVSDHIFNERGVWLEPTTKRLPKK